MLKNKYLVVTIAVSLLALGGGVAGGLLLLQDNASKTTAAVSATQPSTSSGPQQPITISDPMAQAGTQTGQTINGNTTPTNSAGSSGTANASNTNIAQILDPKTFGKYDSYKDAQTASYIDLQTGTGPAIAQGSQVAVLYRGWLTNGTLFDESRAGSDGKLQAFGFTEGQGQVIAGWEGGLFGAKEGGVRMLIVPPAVGYGAQGQGSIPGNAVLIFQVQIVQVK